MIYKDGERHPKFWALKWCAKLNGWITDADDALFTNFPVHSEPVIRENP